MRQPHSKPTPYHSPSSRLTAHDQPLGAKLVPCVASATQIPSRPVPGGSRPSPIPSLPRWINHSAGSANLEAMLGRDLAMPRGWKVGASAAVCGMEIWKGATARDGRELPHQLARTVSHGRALCVAKEGGGRDRGEKRDELDLTTTPLPNPPHRHRHSPQSNVSPHPGPEPNPILKGDLLCDSRHCGG